MNTWDIYPRPRCRRSSFFSLAGEWEFDISNAREPSVYGKRITVPFPPESKLSGVEEGHETGKYLFYRKRFSLPKNFIVGEGSVLLHFGAVDQICDVYLNDAFLGTHVGGYLPFVMAVDDRLLEENVLSLCVKDDIDPTLPYGKQTHRRGGMWYTPFSGIWQTVWMEFVPKGGILDIRVSSTDEEAKIRVLSESESLTLTYIDGEETVTLPFRDVVTVRPKHKELWSPENPYLYRFTVRSESDSAESYFALRKLEVKKAGARARFYLNGEPYLLHGVLDQGYFKDGISTPASPEEYEKDILRMKELGFNMLRKHIKLEPAAFYEACDRLGMIVFQDAVNNGKYSFFWQTALPTVGMKKAPRFMLRKSKEARTFFRTHTRDMLEEISFYPSVLLFTIFNEGWGQADAEALYEEYKALYPSLLFDTASGWFRTDKTDMRSDHVYFKKIKPNYEKEEKPIILSEFGGYSYPVSGHIFKEGHNYGYGTCRDAESFMDRLEGLYKDEVLPAVTAGVSCLVYTQLSDVEDETNGLYTYDREVLKADKERMKRIAEALFDAYRAACKEKHE